MYGPTGVGVLYGKEEWLEKLPPYQGGGEMIATVTFEKTTFEKPPLKFEAGTPDYVATTGLARAIDYLNELGMENVMAYEQELTRYALEELGKIEGMMIYGQTHPLTPPFEGGEELPHDAVISFNVFTSPPSGGIKGGLIHHMDMGTLLDRLGIAVRTGHHCAQPLMDRLGILGTVRASFALYNTKEEVDALVAGIRRVSQMF
jgi:cysteine desulfurase/selenocysteine lyase